MARKKVAAVEELGQDTNSEALGLSGTEGMEETSGSLVESAETAGDETGTQVSERKNSSAVDPVGTGNVPPPDEPGAAPLESGNLGETAGASEKLPGDRPTPVEAVEPQPSPESPAGNDGGGTSEAGPQVTADISAPPVGPGEDATPAALPPAGELLQAPAPTPLPKNDRQSFFDLDFNELDRDLTPEERQEWNSIYASYRGRSALTGTIIGVDPHSISVRNRQTGKTERQTMYCAIVIPYRVRVVIPASEMWEAGHERPDFVLQNMVGATIDFIITKVDRESGFAIGSRRLAARSQRYFFAHRESLRREGTRLKCRILSVGPRRCLVECYGHDLNMTQRDLRYTAIPDLRNEYRPGQELDCVVKSFDAETETLRISVKETESNPFEGAELRHPAGSRRQAVIAGKYGGGVFCNLPDGTVCMCNYSYQHDDSDFLVGDTVILVVQRHEREKRQMYGKILSKW